MKWIWLLNMVAVGIYGMVLSAAFSGIYWNVGKKIWAVCLMAGIVVVQVIFLQLKGAEFLLGWYPLITHIPLVILLYVCGADFLWSLVSVLTAYLCCQLRRWLSLALAFLCFGENYLSYQKILALVVTAPLLFMILRFAAPSIRALSGYTKASKCLFSIIPAASYGFDYLTRVYTNWFEAGSLAVMEFMPFMCSLLYLVFVLRDSSEEQRRIQMEQEQKSLNIQIQQAVREIDAMRKSGEIMRIYRHDMRHHLQYLLSCIENGKLCEAAEHIHHINEELEAGRVNVYCQNEIVNLVFSAFSERALRAGIPMKIRADILKELIISESDLCVLLSNALENALQSCLRQKEREKKPEIEILAYQQGDKIFLQIINSCDERVRFERGIPVASQPGHGIGVQSICAITKKYHGICTFCVKEGRFFLQLSIG